MDCLYIIEELEKVLLKREVLILKQAELFSLGQKLKEKLDADVLLPNEILAEYRTLVRELKEEADQLAFEESLIQAIANGVVMQPSATIQ